LIHAALVELLRKIDWRQVNTALTM